LNLPLRKGHFDVLQNCKDSEEEVHLAEKAVSLGLDVAALNKEQVQPGTRYGFGYIGAVHYRCDAHLYPNYLVAQLIDSLKNMGLR
jgi:D-amino-acid dehydrogenase